ncbi:MAG: hypothetical protein A2Y77_13690 [Planctomycetes bacterium RBG_13_62_9]|nr:MAG: hypothetical protein A2Y77_13690 [Planctomycetes bacterium RBG_13_62_9]
MKMTQVLTTISLVLSLMTAPANADLTLPYAGSISVAGEAFRVNNTYSGTTRSYGGYFEAAGAEGRGVYGRSTSTVPDVNSYGGFFYAAGPKGRGVLGQSAGGQEGIGVKGWASNTGNVQNFGGHFCATGQQGIGVYGWAESLADTTNYGGYFQADGRRGIGVYAIGGPNGYAGLFDGDLKITGTAKGIVFPDGTRQTTAAKGSTSGGGTVACGCAAPSYDSGWVQMTSAGQSKTLTHHLGGSVDDYTVDLQLKRNNIAGQINVTNKGIGQDFYYSNLTTQTVTVVGPQQVGIDYQAWVRIRIWVCPSSQTSPGGGPK